MIAQAARISPSSRARGAFESGQLVDVQRRRLLAAASHAACEHGAGNVTVAHIVSRAGVSRRTFYEIFHDAQDCLLAMLQDALERATVRVLPAWRSQDGWRERVRHALVELLTLFDEDPVLAQLLVVESLACGRVVLEHRTRALARVVDTIDEGRGEARAGTAANLSRVNAEGVVGGVLAVLHDRIGQPMGAGRSLCELAGPLMSMIVLPYLGASVARRELSRPVITRVSPKRDGVLPADPFKASGMRMTYRTLRVLLAVAEHPGASNRLIGQTAGIVDQGQMSKLLSRLARIGLAENTEVQAGKGAPNRWALTPAGCQVVSTIKAHSQDPRSGGSDR